MISRTRSRSALILGAVSALAGLTLAGCGGAGLFGANVPASVLMDVAASGALELRIAPSNGLPSDPLACTETSDGFGCTRDLNGVVAQYKFTTESDASSRPYRVYILNRGSTDLHSSFEVRLDNQDRINHPVIVKANQIMEVARIYRNSVVDLSGS